MNCPICQQEMEYDQYFLYRCYCLQNPYCAIIYNENRQEYNEITLIYGRQYILANLTAERIDELKRLWKMKEFW